MQIIVALSECKNLLNSTNKAAVTDKGLKTNVYRDYTYEGRPTIACGSILQRTLKSPEMEFNQAARESLSPITCDLTIIYTWVNSEPR